MKLEVKIFFEYQMSTDDQVQANFFVYVNCYLNNNGMTPNAVDFINFQSNQFTIGQDSNNGYWSIQSWAPLSLNQPTEVQLQGISPSQINTFRKQINVMIFSTSQPITYQILLDQQNQIRTQQSLTPYNDDQFKSYIATLNF